MYAPATDVNDVDILYMSAPTSTQIVRYEQPLGHLAFTNDEFSGSDVRYLFTGAAVFTPSLEPSLHHSSDLLEVAQLVVPIDSSAEDLVYTEMDRLDQKKTTKVKIKRLR